MLSKQLIFDVKPTENVNKSYKITVYTSENCVFCKSTKQLLRKKKLKFIPGSPPDLSATKPGCRFFDRCPEAMDKCKTDPPKIKTDSGYVLCWLYE